MMVITVTKQEASNPGTCTCGHPRPTFESLYTCPQCQQVYKTQQVGLHLDPHTPPRVK